VKAELSGPAEEVVAGDSGASALLISGEVQYCDNDANGQLGDCGSGQHLSPVNVNGLSQVIYISQSGDD
jgi:hypothetical protein